MARDIVSAPTAAYLKAHSTAPDAVQQQLIERTAALGRASGMQIGSEQGAFLQILVGALRPQLAVEIGTFTGYSSLAIARGLPEGGRLICCDISEEWTAIAQEHWDLAGVADRVELRIGPAADTVLGLAEGEAIDFAFIDADKTGYLGYYEALLPRMSPHGVIAVDNTLWSLRVLDDSDTTDDTVALREFNAAVAVDRRVMVSQLPVGDGVTLIQKV